MEIKEIAKQLKTVSDTPVLDARLLVQSPGNLQEKIDRRLKHEPVSKIIGQKGFWKSDFVTSQDVLDPRPDSETLIEAVLKSCPDINRSYRILDIGVGSGCLLFSLLDEYPNATGVGVDISEKALAISRQNKKDRKATLIQKDFYQTDWATDLGLFDIVISNPPYIPTKDIEKLEPDVRLYDPITALDGGRDGLNAYRALAKSIPALLNKNGLVFLEIGQGQEKDVTDIFLATGFTLCHTVSDFGGIVRVLVFQKS